MRFLKLPLVSFNSKGEICASDRSPPLDNLYSAFGNRVALNDWCNSNLIFQTNNSVGIENFYNEVPWCELMGFADAKYFWGNECVKKVIKRGDRQYGTCPLVYGNHIYQDKMPKFSPRYQTVYMPKRDNTFKTWLSDDQEKISDFINELEKLNLENPIYIAFCEDYPYYLDYYPKSITDNMYCIGYNGFDADWIVTSLQLLSMSEVVYCNGLTSSAVYASYMRKPVKFYKQDIMYKPEVPEDFRNLVGDKKFESEKIISQRYTVCWDARPKEWVDFMKYIQDVFENDLEDKNFWLSNFLSLDQLKPPEELYETLLTLHERYCILSKDPKTYANVEITPFVKSHDLFEQAKEDCDFFTKNSSPSELAKRYYDAI